MQHVALNTETIARVGYDEAALTLEIAFTDGRVVRYHEVPAYLFLGLTSATSPERFHQTLLGPGAYRSEVISPARG